MHLFQQVLKFDSGMFLPTKAIHKVVMIQTESPDWKTCYFITTVIIIIIITTIVVITTIIVTLLCFNTCGK